MKRFSHLLAAHFLILIYVAIAKGPLAPLFMPSSGLARAVAGECTGDCKACGCSPEKKNNHTCCCWRKRMHLPYERETVTGKVKHYRMKMLRCACPCGDKKLPGLIIPESSEHLPYRFAGEIVVHDDPLASVAANRLSDRPGDSPDPPPKLSLHSC